MVNVVSPGFDDARGPDRLFARRGFVEEGDGDFLSWKELERLAVLENLAFHHDPADPIGLAAAGRHRDGQAPERYHVPGPPGWSHV